MIGYESEENSTFRENYQVEEDKHMKNPSKLKDQESKIEDAQQ